MSRRIGVFRVGSLGDHLIALPLYRRLKELHVDDCMILFSNLPESGNQKKIGPGSLLPEALFDAVHNYPVGSGWRNAIEKLKIFRSSGIERLYYLMPPRSRSQLRRDRLFFRLARVPVVGLTAEGAERGARYVADAKLYEHEADRLARAIPALQGGLQKTPPYRSLQLTSQERMQARALIGRPGRCAVALSVGTKCEVNDWGVANWSQLVAKLAAIPQIDHLLIIGSADEFAACEILLRQWPRRSANFCGRLSPRLSAAVLSESKLFIGHDSGPMHMAAAVDVPIVAIFSSRNLPGVWFPLSERRYIHYTHIECMGCGRWRCDDRHKECITRITVDEVYESCRAALAQQESEACKQPVTMNADT